MLTVLCQYDDNNSKKENVSKNLRDKWFGFGPVLFPCQCYKAFGGANPDFTRKISPTKFVSCHQRFLPIVSLGNG